MKVLFTFYGFLLSGALIFACSKKEDKKNDSAPVTTTVPSGSGLPPGDSVTPSGPPKTMEQCRAEGTAWIAVVNGGASPATCGAPLAEWGCCKEQIVARFQTLSQQLAERIDDTVGNGGFQLYNCSKSAEKKYTLHFVKYPGQGKTEYKEINVEAFAYEPTREVTDCPQSPQIDTPTASNGGNTGTGGDTTGSGTDNGTGTGSGTDTGSSGTDFDSIEGDPTLTFANDVLPIIEDTNRGKCADAGCHGNTNPASVALLTKAEFDVHAQETLDRITRETTEAGYMPQGGVMSFADTETLIKYIRALP